MRSKLFQLFLFASVHRESVMQIRWPNIENQISSETTYAITKKNRRTTIETNRSNPPKQSIIAEPRYNWGPLSTPLSFLARFFLSLLRAARDDLIDRSCRHDRIKPRNGQPRAKKKEKKKKRGSCLQACKYADAKRAAAPRRVSGSTQRLAYSS